MRTRSVDFSCWKRGHVNVCETTCSCNRSKSLAGQVKAQRLVKLDLSGVRSAMHDPLSGAWSTLTVVDQSGERLTLNHCRMDGRPQRSSVDMAEQALTGGARPFRRRITVGQPWTSQVGCLRCDSRRFRHGSRRVLALFRVN